MATQTKTTLPDATTSTFNADLQAFLRQEDADRYDDLFISHVVSGGTHSTGASLTQTPASLTAYCGGYYVTETGSITYPDDATHIYVIAHKDTTSAVTNWTRVTGTHYLFRTGTAAEPSLPDDSCWLMKVTTSSGSVTAVEDRRLRRPYPLHVSTSAPTSTDDDSKGFFVGFTWVDTSTDTIYQMADATTGAAVWDTVAGIASTLRDADGDTYIRTEQNADEDIIRFGVAGSEVGHWNSTRFKIEDTVEIHSSDNTISALHFGDPEDADVGRITYDHSANAMRFYANATQKVRLDSTGLGIGNDSPSEALDVTGNIAASGNIKAGGYLDFNKQTPTTWYSGDIAGARWLTKLGGFNLSWLNTLATAGYESITGPDSETYYSTIRFHGTNGLQVYGNASFSTGTGQTIIGSTSGDASAILDLVSTTKGLGLTTWTTTQRDNIASPRDGLIGHNSTTNTVDARLNGAWTSLGGNFLQLTRETAQATTSGTSKDFTNLPAGANRITVIFDQVSLDGADRLLVQIGDSGGLETTSYESSHVNQAGNGASNTTGFVQGNNSASSSHSGNMTLERITGNRWIEHSVIGLDASANVWTGSGTKTLSAELTRLRIVVSGSNNLDGGQINVFVEV